MGREENIDKATKKLAADQLEDAIKYYLAEYNATLPKNAIPKIGRFILALASVEPTIPLQGKHLRDLSTKQRILFNSRSYQGRRQVDHGYDEFLGHWVDKERCFFVFSRKTVSVAKNRILEAPGKIYKILARLCHERPDPVIAYEKLAMAVPRFVKDMQSGMKYMSISEDYQFENAEKPGKGLWIRTAMVNVLLSILDHQDVHVRRGKAFVVVYNRWFAAYFEGE